MQKSNTVTTFLQAHGGVARFSSILKAGFHSDVLKDAVENGLVEKVARGLYRLTGLEPDAYPDLVLTSLQAPRGVVCLLSALYFHEATSEIPRSVIIAIPAGARANRIAYPPVSYYRFSEPTWKAGVEEHDLGGHTVRIYSLAKTVADCFKFRNRIGADVARDALKTAVHEKGIKPADIMHYAGICRVGRIIKPVLEMIV